jgi:hypothetical protein
VEKNLGVPDALSVAPFSARPLKILALTAQNHRNLLSLTHFLHAAFYSAVSAPALAADL